MLGATCAESVLVLHYYDLKWNDAILIDKTGNHKKANCITIDKYAHAYKACSVIWRNFFHVIGDSAGEKPREVLKLVDLRLTQIGQLNFDHYWGACNNFNDEKLFLSWFRIVLKLRSYFDLKP